MFDLDLDLEEKQLIYVKERIWELESKKSTSYGAPLYQIRGQNLPPSKMTNRKYGGAAGKKKVAGVLVIGNLTQVGNIMRPPQLIIH